MRPVTSEDGPHIVAALRRLVAKSTTPLAIPVDFEVGLGFIQDRIDNDEAFIVGDFLVVFSLSRLWFTTGTYLMEELVLRIYPKTTDSGSTALDIPHALINRATELKCAGVFSGDSQTGIMASAYEQAGYLTAGRQFFWRLR